MPSCASLDIVWLWSPLQTHSSRLSVLLQVYYFPCLPNLNIWAKVGLVGKICLGTVPYWCGTAAVYGKRSVRI